MPRVLLMLVTAGRMFWRDICWYLGGAELERRVAMNELIEGINASEGGTVLSLLYPLHYTSRRLGTMLASA